MHSCSMIWVTVAERLQLNATCLLYYPRLRTKVTQLQLSCRRPSVSGRVGSHIEWFVLMLMLMLMLMVVVCGRVRVINPGDGVEVGEKEETGSHHHSVTSRNPPIHSYRRYRNHSNICSRYILPCGSSCDTAPLSRRSIDGAHLLHFVCCSAPSLRLHPPILSRSRTTRPTSTGHGPGSSSHLRKMPATDSPAILVARFLKANHYNEVGPPVLAHSTRRPLLKRMHSDT